MDLATQTHLTTIRSLLTYRLRELQAEVHAAELSGREPTGALAHEVADRKDDAALRQNADIDDAQEQRDVDEIALVTAALQRLEDGSYGDCADCGEPIPMQRLLVQPAARRCAECQAVRERRAGK